MMDYSSMSDSDLLKLCVWREARGAQAIDWMGVASVILNRARKGGWWGNSIPSVILHPMQFSSFNDSDPNSTKFPDANDTVYLQISDVCDGILAGKTADPTWGACWYNDHSIVAPQWSEGLQISLQTQFFTFYRTPEPTTSVTDVEL